MNDDRFSSVSEVVDDLIFSRKLKPAKVVAADIGYDYRRLQRELSPDDRGAKLGADMLIPVMKAVDSLEPLQFLARRMDSAVVDLRRIRAAMAGRRPDEVMGLCLEAAQAFGEVAEAVRASLADGRVTQRERDQLSAVIWDNLEALVLLDEAVKSACAR